jgi:hypothetical protein
MALAIAYGAAASRNRSDARDRAPRASRDPDRALKREDPPGTRTPRKGPAMKTRPNTTACLKLVAPNGPRAVMVAGATTGRNGQSRPATLSNAPRVWWSLFPAEINRPLTRGRGALEFGAGWLVLRWR